MSDLQETLAAYHLAYNTNGDIVDERTGDVFDSERYSRMKYGDKAATQYFASQLAHVLTQQLPQFVEHETPPEFLVAYKAVPPACYHLSRYCLDHINTQRLAAGNEPGRIIHVYKNRVAGTDYAAASPEARLKELDSIGFSLEGRNIDGKLIAVLDDIRITGAAEYKILEVLEPKNPSIIGLGYVAVFNQQQAAVSPSVERDLNLSVIKNVLDILPAVAHHNFDLNIRTLKMVLGSEAALREEFLLRIPDELFEQIARGSVDTGPDFVRAYQQGFDMVMAMYKNRMS